MPRKKKEEITETKKVTKPKKQEVTPQIQEATPQIQEIPEAVYIYHEGDNLQEIAKVLTGHEYLMYRMIEYSGLTIDSLKDGDIIKWKL